MNITCVCVRNVVSVSTSRSRDGLETRFPNVSVSSRSRASESRLQVTFFSYIERKLNDIFALKFTSIITQFPFKVLESSISTFNPNQYTWGPRGPQAYVLCDILRSVRYFFAKLYVFLTPSYVIIVTKYHLLGLGPKACTYNFALGSAWTPSTSILRHSVSMSLIVYLRKIFAW